MQKQQKITNRRLISGGGSMNQCKVYVTVVAEFSKEGLLLPKSFVWEDGRTYIIDRVKDKRRAASTKAGGVGERYTCLVEGKEVFLYYEDNNMWFMERAGA